MPRSCSVAWSPRLACVRSTPVRSSGPASWRRSASCRSPWPPARRSPGPAGSPSSPDDPGFSRPRGRPAPPLHATDRPPHPAPAPSTGHAMTFPAPARDLAVLVTRVAVGLVFVAHGLQKLFTNGIDGTAAFFDQVGVPAASAAAWFAAVVELAGGAALILGLAVPVAGLLLLVDMIGAFAFVHAGAGLFVQQGGYEFVLVLAAAALMLAVLGAGRFSVDHLLVSRGRTAQHVGA